MAHFGPNGANDVTPTSSMEMTRKDFFAAAATFGTTALLWNPDSSLAEDLTVYQMPSGLKYVELEVGNGPSPQYGQLVSIQYTAYVKLPPSKDDPNPKPQQFDQQPAYLLKHGNGRLIPGLDEGLHTMKVNGRRRLLIPPKLGYIDIGIGPIPEYPWDRFQLNRMLDKMVEVSGGTLVFDVKLLAVRDDEADQGYYTDASPSQEELDTLQQKAGGGNSAGATAQNTA